MFEEILTVGLILGASAGAVWLAKLKFQPAIEKEIESSRKQFGQMH